MIGRQQNVKHIRSYSFPRTKLRNVFCIQCKHQFFLREFVPLRGVIPLLLDCGHVICDTCAQSISSKPCPVCNMVPECKDDQTVSLPLHMYALGLMVMSHNRPVGTDDSDISFSKPINVKSKQQCTRGLCYECGIQAAIKCLQCPALYCFICYSKIHGRALQNHTKIILSEGTDENLFTIKNVCSERCTEPLGYYCENCDIAGCSHCMLRLHKKHNYKPLLTKNQDLVPELQDAMGQVQENLKRIRQAQKKLKRTASYPIETQNVDNAETTVAQHFAYLHGVLQNVERKIIDSLHEHRSSRNKNIDEISMQLSEHEDRLQSAMMVTESITKNLDKIDIQGVIRKLKTLVDIPCHLVLDPASEVEQISVNIDRNVVGAIEKHCTVHVPKASSFSLQRTKLLPEDYEIEPLSDEINTSSNITFHEFQENLTDKTASTTVSLPAKKNENLPAVGTSETVNISHVEDPSCFYVQLAQNKHKLAELASGLTVLANTYGVIPTKVTLNALYIVQCSKDRMWYRARVTRKIVDAHGDEKYSVMFIDYGMKEENVPLSRMRNIIPQYAMYTVMALRCTLYDVVPNDGKWHPDATRAFKKLIDTNVMASMCIMMITGDTYYVDLCVISAKDSRVISVKDSLTYMKYATCVSPNKLMRTNPDSSRKYYKEQLELESYVDVQILFVESPNSIYVQKTHGNRSYFMKLIHEMTQDYEQNASSIEYIPVPCKDLPCAARGVDGRWHRGLVTEVTENIVKVFYVDVGYTLILNHDSIRMLAKKYMSCKTQAIRVSLRNIKPLTGNKDQWESETIEFLKKFLMDTSLRNFRVIAFDKHGDTHSVAMYTYDRLSIAHVLVREGLAQNMNGSMTHKPKNRRSKIRKNVIDVEAQGEPYGGPSNTSVRSLDDNEDPFKISVIVHQVQSPDCIYVSDAMSDQTNVEQMMKQMQEFYCKYRSAKQDVWSKDAVCVVYLSKSEMYYRARIADFKHVDKVVVFLYDIGIEETVSINDIQSLHPMFSKTSTYVFKIKLSGILPCGGSSTWPTLSCEKLHEIINNNHNCKFYISKVEDEDVEDAAIPVELWIKQVRMDGPLEPTRHEINSVNRMLVEKGVALPVKEYANKRDKILAIELKRQLLKKLERLTKCESNIEWYEINNDVDKPLAIDINQESDNQEYSTEEMYDNIPLLPKLSAWLPASPIMEDSFIAIPTYLDHNGFLYLHSKDQNAKMLQYIEMKLGKLYNNCPIESCDTVWATGDMCIAQYHADKKWYRGRVTRVQENDTIEVKFVDYGNVEECSIGTLKKKVILQDIPIQCTKCSIQDLNPGNECGKWRTEDLDRIHSLLIDRECEVNVIDRSDIYPVISLTVLPNEHYNKKCDLISFLINIWKMNIVPNIDTTLPNISVSSTDTPDVVIENSRTLYSDDEIIQDVVISGNSVLHPHSNDTNENESDSITDIENLSWCKVKNEIISSTPHVASEENLSISYKTVNIPKDVEYIEVELCCSISPTEFYAQLKENTHSMVLNAYYQQYEHLMNDLQESGCKQPILTTLASNTPCCAKFDDDLWYRCLITECEPIAGSGDVEVKLLYVDYGNSEYRIVNLQEKCKLHTIKKEWFDVPTMAIKCTLWNVELAPAVDYGTLLPQLEEMYDKRVIATIKDTSEEFMSIEVYEDIGRTKLMYSSLIEKGLFQIKSEEN